MKLKCNINGKEYQVATGAVFADVGNEQLDSGSILLPGVIGEQNFKPFDDVYVYEEDFDISALDTPLYYRELKSEYSYVFTNDLRDRASFALPQNMAIDSTPVPFRPDAIIFKREGGIGYFIDFFFKENAESVISESPNLTYICGTPFFNPRGDHDKISSVSNVLPLTMTFSKKQGALNLPDEEIEFRLINKFGLESPLGRELYFETVDDTSGFEGIVIGKIFLDRVEFSKSQTFVVGNITYTLKDVEAVVPNVKKTDRIFNLKKTFTFDYNAFNEYVPLIFGDNAEDKSVIHFYQSNALRTGPLVNYTLNEESAVIRYDIGQSVPASLLFDKVGDKFVLNVYLWASTSMGLISNVLKLDKEDNYIELKALIRGYERAKPIGFYKHLLIDSFTDESVNIDDDIHKYKITLISETKALEKVILPNVSITPRFKQSDRITIWEKLTQYMEMYCPKRRVATNEYERFWDYVPKYVLDPNLESTFGQTLAPEKSITTPTFRELLTQLFLVKNMIPYVQDGVIKGYNLSLEQGEFNESQGKISFVHSSMVGGEFSTELNREYSGAISPTNSTREIEYLGFRADGKSLMSYRDLELLLSKPLYKMNKVWLCCFRKASFSTGSGTVEKNFLCKIDITPLVIPNSVRNSLTSDWEDASGPLPADINDLANYRMSTIGYDIGSRKLTGFGDYYSFPIGWFSTEVKTAMETLVKSTSNLGVFGLNTFKYVYDGAFINVVVGNPIMPNVLNSAGKKLKGWFFSVDYQGFFDGKAVFSKDDVELESYGAVDNSSDSLTLVDLDGNLEKDKVNRIGNKTYRISARYENFSEVAQLFTRYKGKNIIYAREYAIYNDYVLVNYTATEYWVMKNYWTQVFAKNRITPLLTYEESVKRAENYTQKIMFSKKYRYFENNMSFGYNNMLIPQMILSSFQPSPVVETVNDIKQPSRLNFGYYKNLDDTINDSYLSGISVFPAGHNLIMNLAIKDNISGGQYVRTLASQGNEQDNQSDSNLLVGSRMDWYKITNNFGEIDKIKVGFARVNPKNYFYEDNPSDDTIKNNFYERLNRYPQVVNESTLKKDFEISKEFYIYKDNKEALDITFQFEILEHEEDIFVGNYFWQLNDLVGNEYKVQNSFETRDEVIKNTSSVIISSYRHEYFSFPSQVYGFGILIKIPKSVTLSNLAGSTFGNLGYMQYFLASAFMTNVGMYHYYCAFKPIRINSANSSSMSVDISVGQSALFINEVIWTPESVASHPIFTSSVHTRTFTKATEDSNYYYYWYRDENDLWNSEQTRWGGYGYTLTCFGGFNGSSNATDIGLTNSVVDNATINYELDENNLNRNYHYYRNMYLFHSENKIEENTIYGNVCDYTPDNDLGEVNKAITLVDESTIRINLQNVPETAKSIQYWYKKHDYVREDSEVEPTYSWNFIIGVNITSEDRVNQYIDLKMSIINSLGVKVWGKNGVVVGTSHKYHEGDEKIVEEKQLYDDIM